MNVDHVFHIKTIAYKFVLLFIFSELIKHLLLVYFLFMIMVSNSFHTKKKVKKNTTCDWQAAEETLEWWRCGQRDKWVVVEGASHP